MKNLTKIAAVLMVLAVVFGVLLGWGGERKAMVTSQPLPCVEMGMVLVCFDSQPVGPVQCDQMDPTTIICTQTH